MNPSEIVSYLKSQNRISPQAERLLEVVVSLQPQPALKILGEKGIARDQVFKVGPVKLACPIPRLEHFALAWNVGVGAPQAVLNLEVLAALGARRFVGLGFVGALDGNLEPGEVVWVQDALSGEGTSRYYGRKEEQPVKSSEELGKLLVRHGFSNGIKAVRAWSVDAPSGASVRDRDQARELGAKVVDMEASAIFQWAKCRGVEVSLFGVVSDRESGEIWEPKFHQGEVQAAALSALKTLVKVCALSSFAR